MIYKTWLKTLEKMTQESGYSTGKINSKEWRYYYSEGFTPEGALAAEQEINQAEIEKERACDDTLWEDLVKRIQK